MKHNVSLCPEAHLLYSCSGIWPCETQQLFYFLLALFVPLSLQCEMSWHRSLVKKRVEGEGGGALKMDYPVRFYTVAQSSVLLKSENGAT